MGIFSLNLRRLRKIYGLSQEELANKLNVTRQTISGWETGRCQPDIEMLSILADVLQVDIDTLLRGDQLVVHTGSQKKYMIWAAVSGGVVAAMLLFWLFLFPIVDTYIVQHFLGRLRYFLYCGLPQIGFFVAGLFAWAVLSLFRPLHLCKWQRCVCILVGIGVALPWLLIFISTVLPWQPGVIVAVQKILLYRLSRAILLYILPFLSGVLVLLLKFSR